MQTGRCECGAVAFEVDDPRDTVTFCHCSQCRRTSGHLWASTMAAEDSLRFTETRGLKWFASSDFAKRGFCTECGSSLFYKMHSEDKIAIAVGAFDDISGFKAGKHIFCKDKGAYYSIASDETQIEKY